MSVKTTVRISTVTLCMIIVIPELAAVKQSRSYHYFASGYLDINKSGEAHIMILIEEFRSIRCTCLH